MKNSDEFREDEFFRNHENVLILQDALFTEDFQNNIIFITQLYKQHNFEGHFNKNKIVFAKKGNIWFACNQKNRLYFMNETTEPIQKDFYVNFSQPERYHESSDLESDTESDESMMFCQKFLNFRS